MFFGVSYSFIFLACSLVLWISFFEQKRLNKVFGVLTLFALFGYALYLFGGRNSIPEKMGELSLNLFLLTVISLISQFAKKYFLLKIAWLSLLGFFVYTTYQQINLRKNSEIINELDPNAEFLVDLHMKGEIPDDLKAFIDKYNIRTEEAFEMFSVDETVLDDYIILDIPSSKQDQIQEIYEELNKIQSIDWVEPNEMVKLDPLPPGQSSILKTSMILVNDPDVKKQWSYTKTGMNDLYNFLNKEKTQFQKRAKLFILDTGIDAYHEDLANSFLSSDVSSDSDTRGHGTHCAGIAGAVSNNNIGIASVAPDPGYYTISSIKVINDMGYGFQRNIINGMLKAADEGADVISMSLGAVTNQRRQSAYNDAVAYANLKNAIVVVAAGNSNENAINYSPANSTGVLTVSAVDEDLNKANFSNTVQDIQYGLAAPGVNIYSTMPENKYASLSGTSMAAPHVSGLVALMKSFEPSLNTEEVYQILNKTGIPTSSKKLTGNFIQSDKAIIQLLQ